MGSELKIEVTEKERHFRANKKSEILGIAQREVSCCSCGNVLSKKSGRIQSHPIFGIFQCEYCKKFLQKASFKSRKGDSVKLCYICGRDNKETYGCKKEDCPYAFCKNCIKRITPNSLPAAKSGGWECFACNTQPLWMLRGACTNVISDLSKRTKENVVESRNVSSDSEDSRPQTSDLRNISYVKRTRVEETKRLGKRLKAVCDEESPVQQEEKPRSANDRQNKRGKSDDATKREVKHVSNDKSSRSHRKLTSSSEDSSLEEIVIPKSKTVVKSQSEREKRMSKNARTSETRKSRNSESHDRRKPIILDSSSDDDSDAQSDLENSRSYRKSKHKDDNLSKKRKAHRTTRESSVNESKSSNSRSKSSHNEKMPSTRQSKSHRKNRKSESSDDSSSSDSETEAIKGSKSSLFSKAKSDGVSKMAKRRKGKECSDDEPTISTIKSKADLKSSSSRSSNMSSKSSKTKSKHPDSIEEVEEEEEAESRKKAKKSSVKSPGPKSFKEGKIPRRERSSDEDEGRGATRSSKNKEKKKSVPSRRDSEVGGFAKSIGRRLSKTDKQTSDSSSGKEFNKSKVLRSSFVVLRPIQDIQEDHTTSPNEDPEIDDTSEIISKDQTFGLKNSVNHFYSEMKTAATKLLNDIEKARKTYSMKDSMRVEEVNLMVLETKRLAERVRNVVDKGDTKVTEYYDKWCTKTRIKNVLKKQSTTPKPKSNSKPEEESSKKPVSVEETREKSPEKTILNGANNVESECGSEKIVSDAESSMSIDNSSLSPPDKNSSQKKVHVPIESSNREASTLKKSDKPALSSDNEISDSEAKIQSPTMSQFSGLSDAEENTELQEKTVSPTSEAKIASTEDDEIPPEDSDNEQVEKSNDKSEKSDGASSESSKTRKIQREPRVVLDSDIEDSALAVKTPPRLQTEQSNSEADPLETSADIFEDSDNNEEISDSEKKLRPTETKKKDADAVMKEPENSQHGLDKDALDNESENPQESLDKDALNNESENPQEHLDEDALNNESENPQEHLDEDALNNESENPQVILDEEALNNESEKTPEKDPLAVEKEHSEVESVASSDIASADTELMNYSPSKLSDDTEEVVAKSPKEAREDGDEEKEVEDEDKKKKKKEKEKEKEAVEEEDKEKEKKKKKKQKKEKEKEKESVEEEEEDKEKKMKQKKKKEKKAVEEEDKEAVEDEEEEEEEEDKAKNKEKEKEAEEEEEEEEAAASVAKQPKKVDSARNSDSDQLSSAETVLNDEIMNDDKSPGANESSDEILESENARAKAALLMSSNSDDSSCDERESTVQSTPNDGNDAPPTPPESDSKSDKNSVDHSPEIESTEKIRKKRSKFRINENRHFMADEKLQRKCVIKVERLKEKNLRQYSRALRKSRDYVESKKLQRLVALDKLGKDQKKSSIDCSENEDETSSKDIKRNKKSRSTKEKEETLLDHLNKVKNGETISELSSQSDSESSTRGNKEKDKNKSEDRLLTEANRMAKKRLLESSDSNAEEQPASDAKEEEASKKTKKVIKKEKLDKKSEEDEEKKEEESGKNRWRKSKILTLKISDSDSDAEEKKFNTSQEKLKKKNKEGSQSESDEASAKKKKKQARVRRRVLHSDSDVVISSEESDSDSSVQSVKKKKKKKGESNSEEEKDKKKTRKRTRRTRRSSDSSSSLDERPKATRRKRIKKTGSESDSDDQDGSPGKSGRKNIRKVLRDKQVAEDTKQAAKEEEERLKRIAERQKLYNEMYEVRLAGEEKVDKLVLDFDEETKEPLVSVHEGLVKRLKPHQAQGIKFMWDACFESLERIKSTKGSGCILAHCMGLGKSFQVVTLAHTLLTHEATAINTVLVVCPLSTVLNWANEFKIWLADIDNGDDIEVYEMTKMKKNFERKFQLARWQETGGVMIIGYEMFRNLTQQTGKKVRKNIQETFLKCLVDPGPDLIVCDEGHLLKNEDTALSKAMRRVKTLRRVVLTGTPLQNNLIEYHCMVQFVKPNLLGTKKEFMNRFENPITNGQFDDSTEYDVKLMKKRAHILHKLLEGSVQRFDYSVLTPFLPPKQEYVIFVKLTKIQLDMYQHYLDNYARRHRGVGGSLFADFQALQRIWTHPMVMQMNAEKVEKANEKKRLDATDSEGSLRDFIDDGSDTPCTSNSSDDASDDDKKAKSKRSTRANPVVEEPVEEVAAAPEEASTTDETQWWAQYVKEEDYEDIRCSSKLLILFRIIKESEQIGDKILVFSQSLYSLTLIERFLEMIDEETQKGTEPEKLDGLSGSWALGLDYFRLDGQTSADNRRRWCDIFNRPSNTRARLFLISTRAGGLGINLTAANRVVIFDASWNPSHDVQSIFRIYRFGQKKPCYVYRLLAAGTMEEKIYNRQVTKLSLSCRVVDEQQIERHYSNNALAELYKLELPSETETTLALPKDRLLAEIFLKYKHSVENYHEHDSLLENQAGEELDEEERQQAWLEYEEEKKGKRVMVQQPFINYQDAYLMQQINAMNMASQQNTLNNPAMFSDYQNLQRLMEKDYPGIPEAQQKIMASQAVYEMYNYVEKQAMASHRGAAGGGMQLPNLGGLQGMYNNQVAQSVNPRQTYMDVLRMQQQLLAQQQQNGQVKFANSQQQLRADILRQQQQQQLQFAQQAQRMGQSSTTAAITIDDDDIMEVPSVPEKSLVPPAQASEANPKNKEE